MKVENLRSLIRENIHSYLKEIDEAAKIGAIKASITKCEEAIGIREKKMNMEGLDEAYKDMLDKNKMAELKSEIKALNRSLEKYKKQLAKFEKVDEVTDEVVTDEAMVTDEATEEAPIATEDVMSEMDVEETALNESFLKMQKLAGVITEAQYNEKKRLIENQLNEDNLEVKSIAKKLYSWLKQNGVAASLATQNVNFKQIGIQDPKQQEATIYVFDDPSSKQTIIRVSLRGKESIVKDVENKLLTTYPGLEEFNKQQYKLYSGGMTNPQEIPGAINLTFDLKEKTTAKGGLVGNTKTNENQLNEEEKTMQAFGPRLMDGLKKNGFDTKMTTNDQEAKKLEEFVKTSDKKLAIIHYMPSAKFIQIATNKDNLDDAFKVVDSPFVKELLPDGFTFFKQGSYFIQIQGK